MRRSVAFHSVSDSPSLRKSRYPQHNRAAKPDSFLDIRLCLVYVHSHQDSRAAYLAYLIAAICPRFATSHALLLDAARSFAAWHTGRRTEKEEDR